jgi:hypothetical protein
MQIIKDIDNKELRLLCVDLVSKTLVEIGPSKTWSDKEIVLLATSLAEDLKEDFSKLYFIDIVKSFREGVRRTEYYGFNVKTYYNWIKRHRDLIWENEKTEEPQRDKRLKYRSRKNTGMISLKQKLINV